jgi:hypothetical protein
MCVHAGSAIQVAKNNFNQPLPMRCISKEKQMELLPFKSISGAKTLQPTYYEIWFNILITLFAPDRRNKNVLTWLKYFKLTIWLSCFLF